jgi:acylphosphatase
MMAERIQLWQILALVKHKAKKLSNIFIRPPNSIASDRRVWLYAAVPPIEKHPHRRRMIIHYSGRVQGVGFRYTARTVATGFEITGTVRNLPDGRVELIAEGTRPELEAYQSALRDAGLAGFIRDEHVEWADVQNLFRNFEIVR